jgi:hypothetical protein
VRRNLLGYLAPGIVACAIVALGLMYAQPQVNPPTALIVTVDGAAVTGITTLNLTSGNGILWTCTPAPCAGANGVLNIAAAVNTATVVSKLTLQSGVCDFVVSSNGTSGYTYKFGPAGCQALTAYTRGMHFRLTVDVTNGAGNCSLNIDNVGLKSIKQADGLTDPIAGSLLPGREYPIWFDGTVFRLE